MSLWSWKAIVPSVGGPLYIYQQCEKSTKKFGLFVPKTRRNYERSKRREILSPTHTITSQKNSTYVIAVMSRPTSDLAVWRYMCVCVCVFPSLYTQIKIFSPSSFLTPNRKWAQFLMSLMSLWFSHTNFLLRLLASSYQLLNIGRCKLRTSEVATPTLSSWLWGLLDTVLLLHVRPKSDQCQVCVKDHKSLVLRREEGYPSLTGLFFFPLESERWRIRFLTSQFFIHPPFISLPFSLSS